jgi:hypothetical protein
MADANFSSIVWAEPIPPEPDRLVADIDHARGQQILYVVQRQRVVDIHMHDQPDDVRRAAKVAGGVFINPG